MADIDPAPPGIIQIDPAQGRKFPRHPLAQRVQMRRIGRVAAGDRGPRSDLQPVVGQQPVIVAQGPGIGQRRQFPDADLVQFRRCQNAGHDAVGHDRHQPVPQPRMQPARGIGRRCHRDATRADGAAGRAQVMDAILQQPALDRAVGMDPGAQFTGHAQIAEGQFGRMDAGAVGFPHGAMRLVVTDDGVMQLVPAHHPRAIAERVVQQPGFAFQCRHRGCLMRDVVMAAILWLAIDAVIADQAAEQVKRFGDLGMQALRGIKAPAFDPLAALQPARTDLRLPAIAGGTAIGNAVRLQHGGLDAVHPGQVDGAGQARIARADHRDVHVHVRRDRAVILGRRARRVDPVGRRVIAARSQPAGRHRVVEGIEGHRSRTSGDHLHDTAHFAGIAGRCLRIACFSTIRPPSMRNRSAP